MHHGSWLPIKYFPPPKEAKYEQEIIVNWLQMEVDPSAPARMPALCSLKGWRNREVWFYIKYEMPDWTVIN